MPDVTFFLRLDPEIAAQRQGEDDDRFELEGIEFQRTVAAAYDDLAARNPDRIVVIDADRSVGAIEDEIDAVVAERG
jgi:dTMP kinase